MVRTEHKNQVIKETILFILESTLFTFSIFGSWVMEQSLSVDVVIEVSVRFCIIAFYLIRLWGSEELTEKAFDIKCFSVALIPVFLIFAFNGFKLQNDFSWKVILFCLISATCEEMHFRVNGCHLFREDGNLGHWDCVMLISVFSVCRVFFFIVEGVSLSVMTVMESIATGILLLGYYLKTGNTKSLIVLHTLLMTTEYLEFKSGIPSIELANNVITVVIGLYFFRDNAKG